MSDLQAVIILIGLGYKPMLAFSEVSPVVFIRAYSQENVQRIVTFEMNLCCTCVIEMNIWVIVNRHTSLIHFFKDCFDF